jgi:hypothetical protein
MSLTTVIACGVAIAVVSLIFYALHIGCDVKAALKVAFIGFTFEAKDKRIRRRAKSDTTDAT